MWTIFYQFLVLGCISFGGPAAHLGYFRVTFVDRLKWLSDKDYANIVALSQFLPGPGSSQAGFAIGYHRGGLIGGWLAFIAFTLPSFLLVIIIASRAAIFSSHELFQVIIGALKLLAVVVVLDAALSMYKNFCNTRTSIFICVLSACLLLLWSSLITQLLVIVAAAILGALFIERQQESADNKKVAIKGTFCPARLIIVSLLFLSLFLLPQVFDLTVELKLFSDFFQVGSFVFGGGHVVLPLLQNIVADQLTTEQFLTGYAVAQAVPGPMFTLATYLGYLLLPSAPIVGAGIATIAIFLPGFLLLILCLRSWQKLSNNSYLVNSLSGVNAAVVGLLISALYQPVFISAVNTGYDMAMVLFGFYLLKQLRLSIIKLIAFFIVASLLRYYLPL